MDIITPSSAQAQAQVTTTTPPTPTQTTNTPNTKSPEPETEIPTPISNAKPISFTNGVLKRHHHAPPLVFTYKECLKNHAATMGHHALDGCGEFMPSPTANPTDPTTLKCAACGCHRNFHRKEPDDHHVHVISPVTPNTTTTIEYQPHHRHHPPPPATNRSPNSSSPPPISSSYYPSAPHMLLALSGNLQGPPAPATDHHHNGISKFSVSPASGGLNPSPSGDRKRFRTKFSSHQKDRMFQFAERVGWKMQKRDEEIMKEFCNEIGIDKNVLKVWMHNNKNTFGNKRSDLNFNRTISATINSNENHNGNNGKSLDHVGTNGSSSSS